MGRSSAAPVQKTKLKNFERVQSRHCKTTETHPLKIHFCDKCGVFFFARVDSLKRQPHSILHAEFRKFTPMEATERCTVTAQEDYAR